MSVTVELPDELASRLTAAAAQRGATLEQLAVEAIEARFPPPKPTVSFIGIGASGTADSGEKHRQIVDDWYRSRSADEV